MNAGSGTPLVDGTDIGIGRAALIGAAIGFVVIGSLGVALALFAGAAPGAAAAVGVFAGVFGGPGFGGMLGAVIHVTRASEQPERASVVQLDRHAAARSTTDLELEASPDRAEERRSA